MRFMMIVKATKDSEAGKMPSEELLSAMGKYNEELLKAGVLLDLAGLHPSAKGARIQFANGKRSVFDGPFAETKELIAGYWLIEVKSKQEPSIGPCGYRVLSMHPRTATSSSARSSNLAILLPALRLIVLPPSARSSRNARKPRDMNLPGEQK